MLASRAFCIQVRALPSSEMATFMSRLMAFPMFSDLGTGVSTYNIYYYSMVEELRDKPFGGFVHLHIAVLDLLCHFSQNLVTESAKK